MKSFFLVLTVSVSFTAFAQNASKVAAKEAYAEAGKFISYKSYDKAIEQLKTAVTADNNFTAAYQQLGDIYRRQQRFQEAKESYLKVISIDPNFYAPAYLSLAESEINTGDYQNAITHLTKYLGFSDISESGRKTANKFLQDCSFSTQAIKDPLPFKPVNLGNAVNTTNQEYLPVVTADEETLIFTRQANGNEDFYKSIKKNGQWSPAIFLSNNINTKEFNEGAQCISPDGLYLFFTGCNRPDGMGRCDIYFSKREGKNWSQPFNIGAPVNSPGWESQPSLSADGKTLYFVSTRPGGLGGYDIWKSDLKEGGSWSEPENLGPEINTPFDEQSPFIHPDNETLYFSSNGWPGLGNKDLFMSRKDVSGKWQKPQNLGYPINTFGEESGLFVSSDGKTAFYSAKQKDGNGSLDIYSFPMPEKIRPLPVTYVKGLVVDKKTKEPLDAGVKITNLKSEQVVYDDTSDDEGIFLATMPAGNKFALNIEREGYLFYSQNFSLDKPASANKPFILKIELQKIEPGNMVVLNNIFFDTNKYDLLPESKTELQQLVDFLNKNPKVSIEISGHTDNVGDEKLNLVLSQNRAKSVYQFLTEHKINPARLTYKGYGKSMPVAENTTETGRQQNRRTEFKITSV
ncbi:OmpA family protein [Pedobacter sp. HMF7647]|uniref:OmpA family protein n=1 Tax=Hufsiella arboris TaxID=2695275 RepID=A0A7K1Y9B2_9SPHI|nr:OmpA family protein [Hufsiella arboris]MXV50628.1 OmpA family protein [Hufsiella arboris]